MYRATCTSEDESMSANVFVKMASEDLKKRRVLRLHECFLRESYVYEKVSAAAVSNYFIEKKKERRFKSCFNMFPK